jgi:hypothetical protein
VDHLREELQRRYKEATAEDSRRFRRRVLPDFREYDGVRLQKIGVVLTAEEIEGREIDDIADELVRRAVEFEHGMIVGWGSVGVVRFFLHHHELPTVFLKVLPDHQEAADEEDRGAIKFRHVFAVGEAT